MILCVMQAVQDLATQEALKIAQHLDKEGKRTLGVITKVDMLTQGLQDKLVPMGPNAIRLRLGYVGVRSCLASGLICIHSFLQGHITAGVGSVKCGIV